MRVKRAPSGKMTERERDSLTMSALSFHEKYAGVQKATKKTKASRAQVIDKMKKGALLEPMKASIVKTAKSVKMNSKTVLLSNTLGISSTSEKKVSSETKPKVLEMQKKKKIPSSSNEGIASSSDEKVSTETKPKDLEKKRKKKKIRSSSTEGIASSSEEKVSIETKLKNHEKKRKIPSSSNEGIVSSSEENISTETKTKDLEKKKRKMPSSSNEGIPPSSGKKVSTKLKDPETVPAAKKPKLQSTESKKGKSVPMKIEVSKTQKNRLILGEDQQVLPIRVPRKCTEVPAQKDTSIDEDAIMKLLKSQVSKVKKVKTNFIDFLDSLDEKFYESSQPPDVKSKGEQLFSYLTQTPPALFFKKHWEKQPLLVQQSSDLYAGLFTTGDFDEILRNEYVQFGKNLDLTTYENGKRETHNPVGRAHAPVVWDYFTNGCSCRLLNPQTFSSVVWQTLSCLQEYMGSFCGANVYLTPAGTQGFAPHWDDIEAFVLQLEGRKRWRVYKPRFAQEVLPRFSSPNFSQEEIGTPIIDVVLSPGDMLYMPRGFIHQGEAVEDTHSLHITISCYQQLCWADYMEQLFSKPNLAVAAKKHQALREGLPFQYSEYMGRLASFVSSEKPSKKNVAIVAMDKERKHEDAEYARKRAEFKSKLTEIVVGQLITDELVDNAADAMARQLVRVALPPFIGQEERILTVDGDGETWRGEKLRGKVEMEPDDHVRLIAPTTTRVCLSDGEWKLFYSCDNSREYEGREEQSVTVEEKHLASLRVLFRQYPLYVRIEDLPCKELETRMGLATTLYELGLLSTDCQLHALNSEDEMTTDSDDDEDSDDADEEECDITLGDTTMDH